MSKAKVYASVWDALADTPEQAANLRARAELMQQIAAIVKDSGWTQTEAAEHCGITQPRMNDLLRGRVSRFSLDALVNIATAIGRWTRLFSSTCRSRRGGPNARALSSRNLHYPPIKQPELSFEPPNELRGLT